MEFRLGILSYAISALKFSPDSSYVIASNSSDFVQIFSFKDQKSSKSKSAMMFGQKCCNEIFVNGEKVTNFSVKDKEISILCQSGNYFVYEFDWISGKCYRKVVNNLLTLADDFQFFRLNNCFYLHRLK